MQPQYAYEGTPWSVGDNEVYNVDFAGMQVLQNYRSEVSYVIDKLHAVISTYAGSSTGIITLSLLSQVLLGGESEYWYEVAQLSSVTTTDSLPVIPAIHSVERDFGPIGITLPQGERPIIRTAGSINGQFRLSYRVSGYAMPAGSRLFQARMNGAAP